MTILYTLVFFMVWFFCGMVGYYLGVRSKFFEKDDDNDFYSIFGGVLTLFIVVLAVIVTKAKEFVDNLLGE